MIGTRIAFLEHVRGSRSSGSRTPAPTAVRPIASPVAAEAERDRLRALLAYPLPTLEQTLIHANIERRAGKR